ncbi:unnamed protein product [Polarella glacialis]|uniref:Uncharacterized protein n=1 Tax=Polarella glacialis TaxID=89957 RepID=A0A813H344_POLGL|nr:unnamed protein product [Polarella glacialis]
MTGGEQQIPLEVEAWFRAGRREHGDGSSSLSAPVDCSVASKCSFGPALGSQRARPSSGDVGDANAFLAAAAEGNTEIVRRDLEGRHRLALMATVDSQGRGAAHLACRAGHAEVARLLHGHGADLESVDSHGRTALHLACERGHAELVFALVEFGCRPAFQDSSGRTALHLAACCADPRVCQFLVSKHPELATRPDGQGRTPLFYAVLNPAPSAGEECARLLLASRAEVSSQDSFGFAPLHYAAESGMQGSVALLLQALADPVLQDTVDGRTPLQRAGSEAVINLLQRAVPQNASQTSALRPGGAASFAVGQLSTEGAAVQNMGHAAGTRGDERDIDGYYSGLWDARDGGYDQHRQQPGPEVCTEELALHEELGHHREAMETVKSELEDAHRNERRLLTELQSSLATIGSGPVGSGELEARGEDGGAQRIGLRLLRASRQLAAQGEELKCSEAHARRLERANNSLEEQFGMQKSLCTELEEQQISVQKRLETELFRRGEDQSWQILAEQDRCRAESVAELLGRRLEEAEAGQAEAKLELFALRSRVKEEDQEKYMAVARAGEAESAQLRQELQASRAEAAGLVLVQGLLEAQSAASRVSENSQTELLQSLAAEARQQSLESESEVVRLRQEARKQDEHWQKMFTHYGLLGQVFFSAGAGADAGAGAGSAGSAGSQARSQEPGGERSQQL